MVVLRNLAAIFLFLVAVTRAAAAAPCANLLEAGVSYTVCTFDARQDAVRLFWRDGQGDVYGDFARLEAALIQTGETLVFAMNAGMYGEDRSPIGLYVEAGRTLKSANVGAGAGNFYMKPNGVFWIDGARAGVSETAHFLRSRLHPAYATQSGPLLVRSGRINQRIHEGGQSAKIRNGVGVADGHIVRFVISNEAVTFHAFAHFFRERLQCPDALFLDGSISSLYAPQLLRHDRFLPLGPIVGVVEKKGK
ncbi:MAG: phosphodiester glycosidase family protein [Methylocystis sp.]|nr:phosphodiester glycosidase family protein [Methylocystis sp.]MBI3275242.1 phosphodiester glycosidase family protein [Methylocystis sp.]